MCVCMRERVTVTLAHIHTHKIRLCPNFAGHKCSCITSFDTLETCSHSLYLPLPLLDKYSAQCSQLKPDKNLAKWVLDLQLARQHGGPMVYYSNKESSTLYAHQLASALNSWGVRSAKQLCLLLRRWCCGDSDPRPGLWWAAAALWERGGRLRMDRVEGHDGEREEVLLHHDE